MSQPCNLHPRDGSNEGSTSNTSVLHPGFAYLWERSGGPGFSGAPSGSKPTPPCAPPSPPPPPHNFTLDILIAVGVILIAAAIIALVITHINRQRNRHHRSSLNAIILKLNELHEYERHIRAEQFGTTPDDVAQNSSRPLKSFRTKIEHFFSQNSQDVRKHPTMEFQRPFTKLNHHSDAVFPDIKTIAGRCRFFEHDSERRYYPRQTSMRLPQFALRPAAQRRFQSEPWNGPMGSGLSESRSNPMAGRPLPEFPVSATNLSLMPPVLVHTTGESLELSAISLYEDTCDPVSRCGTGTQVVGVGKKRRYVTYV